MKAERRVALQLDLAAHLKRIDGGAIILACFNSLISALEDDSFPGEENTVIDPNAPLTDRQVVQEFPPEERPLTDHILVDEPEPGELVGGV